MIKYNLFLDDMRRPKDVRWIKLPSVDWCIARSYKDFVETVKKDGLPMRIAFDHDLADEHYAENVRVTEKFGDNEFQYKKMREKTGYDAAKWLVEYCVEWDKDLPECFIHTLNPIGGLNIKSVLENYRKYRESEKSGK